MSSGHGIAVLAATLLATAAIAAPAAEPGSSGLTSAIRDIQNTCFAAYPPDLLARMSGGGGPPSAEIRSNPGLQVKYLKTEEVKQKGLFYPSLLKELVPAFQAEVRHGRTFLDLGSGDGRVVFLAAHMGARATGIEYDQGLHEVALKALAALPALVPAKRARLLRGDFLEADCSRYDVLYYFGTDGTFLEKALLEKLAREMKPGARFLFAHSILDPDGLELMATYGDVKVYRVTRND